MILFILIAVGIALYTIFCSQGLISDIKMFIKYKSKGRYKNLINSIFAWLVFNIFLNMINYFIVFLISDLIISSLPVVKSYYTFNINSLMDNIVTNGNIHGGAYCIKGSIDGDINYFFSRTTDKGEIIGHIPANKSYIKYDDNKTSCIEVHQKNHKVPEFFNKLLFTEWCNDKTTDYYVIVVPDGTISVDGTYEIDMK